MARIFLSYAREDQRLAEDIYYVLVRAGHTAYLDKKTLTPGETYATELRMQIEQADVFVFLISPDSVAPGAYTLSELSIVEPRWIKRDCTIVAALVREIDPRALPSLLRQATYFSPSGNVVAEIVDRLFKTLSHIGQTDGSFVQSHGLRNVEPRGGATRTEQLAIASYFSIPKPLRGTLLLAFALLVVYFQLLLPPFISGKLVNSAAPEKKLSARVHYWIGNHRSSTDVDLSTGGWSLPLYSSWPAGVPVEFEIANSPPVQVRIPFSTIALSRFKPDPIEVHAESATDASGTSRVNLKVVDGSSTLRTLIFRANSVGAAYAQSSSTSKVRISSGDDTAIAVARAIRPSREVRPEALIENVFPDAIERSNYFREVELVTKLRFARDVLYKALTFSDLSKVVSASLERRSKVRIQVVDALKPFAQRNDMWVAPTQPPAERLENALEKMEVATPHKDQLPLALFDATLLGHGGEGMLFLDDGLYFRTSWTVSSGPRVGYIPYDEFPTRTFREGRLYEVSLDRGQFFVTAGSGMSTARVADMLNAVKKAVASVK